MMMNAIHRRVQCIRLSNTTRSMSIFGDLFSSGDKNESKPVAGSSGFQLALLGYVSKTMIPKESLQFVLKKDPNFLMGHVLVGASECLHAYLHSDSQDAIKRLKIANKLAENDNTTKIEQLHVHALNAMVCGRYREASIIYETILRLDETDILALNCAVDLYAILGDTRNILETVTRVLPQWHTNHPGYSHVLGMQAFGIQEAGDFSNAEALANRALSMNEEDAGAFHTLMHIYESQGKHQDGASVISRNEDSWKSFAVLRPHLYIHWIYFLIETGRFDRVLHLLKNEILQPGDVLSAKVLVDVTQVFWRLRFAGYDVPWLIEELNRQWQIVIQDSNVAMTPLAILHAQSVLALTEPGKQIPAEKITDAPYSCDITAIKAMTGIETITPFSFGLPGNAEISTLKTFLEAFQLYGQGEHKKVVDHLLSVRGNVHAIGGTRVEAELIELILIDSARRSSQYDLAKLLLNERLSMKSQSAQYWKIYGDILEDLNDAEGVDGARRMSYVLGLGQTGAM